VAPTELHGSDRQLMARGQPDRYDTVISSQFECDIEMNIDWWESIDFKRGTRNYIIPTFKYMYNKEYNKTMVAIAGKVRTVLSQCV
jgi:hypothetical protein